MSDTPPAVPAPPSVEEPTEPAARKSNAPIYIALIVIVLAAAALVGFNGFNASTPATTYPTQQLVSTDWGGYSVSSDLLRPQASVTEVSGSWMIPAVRGSTDSFSAAWVGIGGQYDMSLIQTGTEHSWENGSPRYFAWYELLPGDAVHLNMTLAPGDTISASVNLQNAASDMWLIEIRNLSNGQTFRQTFTYSSSMSSAEWIVERPVVNGIQYPLTDFGSLTFTGCSATISGRTDVITGFPHSVVTLKGKTGYDLVTVSDTSAGGASFTVEYVPPTSPAV